MLVGRFVGILRVPSPKCDAPGFRPCLPVCHSPSHRTSSPHTGSRSSLTPMFPHPLTHSPAPPLFLSHIGHRLPSPAGRLLCVPRPSVLSGRTQGISIHFPCNILLRDGASAPLHRGHNLYCIRVEPLMLDGMLEMTKLRSHNLARAFSF